MPLQIELSFHHFEPSAHDRERLEGLIGELEKFADSIISGRVVVDGAQKHGHKTVAEIKVELNLPKGTAIGKRSAEYPAPAGQFPFDKAATEAFHVAMRQVREHVAKMRPQEVKQLQGQLEHARVVRVNRTVNNGFIEMPNGESVFFAADVLEGNFENLEVGQEVAVKLADGEGPYGPMASSVKTIAPLS